MIIVASMLPVYAPVATSAFAAIAAGASWATVAQNRKERELAQAPDLSIRLSLKHGSLILRVHNVGGGPATGVNYLLILGADITWDVVSNGYLGPGEDTQFFRTSMPASRTLAGTEYVCVVTARDSHGVLRAWSQNPGQRVVFKPSLFRGEATPSKQEIVATLFPGVVLEGKRELVPPANP
jgi:hypothetical protein